MKTNLIKIMSLALLINTSFGSDSGIQEEECNSNISRTSSAPHLSELGQKQADVCLMYSVIGKDMEVAQMILDKGANINAKDVFGHTPLIESILSRNDDMSILLIENGADVNILTKDRVSCLMMSFDGSSEEVSEKLVMYGADIVVRNKAGILVNALQNCKNEKLVKKLTRYKSITQR